MELSWDKPALNQGVCNWFMPQFALMVLSCPHQMVFISSKQRKQKLVQKLEALLINLIRAVLSSHFIFMPVGDKKALRFIIVTHTAIPYCRIHDDRIFLKSISPGTVIIHLSGDTRSIIHKCCRQELVYRFIS